jgi:hypothetical protein
MSNRARAGLVALAVIIAVVAFVALRPGDDSKKSDSSGQKAGQTTTTGDKGPTATAPSAPAPPLDVTLKGGKPVGGVKSLKVKKGDVVRLQVRTDEKVDQLHLHGYDIEKEARAGKPADFKFKASIEGVFELESHTAEDAGREPLVARLVVEPS